MTNKLKKTAKIFNLQYLGTFYALQQTNLQYSHYWKQFVIPKATGHPLELENQHAYQQEREHHTLRQFLIL